MKYKHLSIYLFGFLSILSGVVAAQNSTDWLNQQASIPIASPNVVALNKFVEFPVSHFNGQVNVSFPLYEIKLKNITIPITLKYHTGGIRVSEEASWVGLGWALDAGGVISHQVNGKDDVAYNNAYSAYGSYFHYPNKADNETYNPGVMFIAHNSGILYDKNGQEVDAGMKFHSYYDEIDGEPDLYIYNMGGYSGKFIHYDNTPVDDFSRNKTCIDLSCNNMLFKQYIGNASTGDSIIATDPNGNIYTFKDIETSFTITGIPNSMIPASISAYHLSEILTPNGERIKFHYKTFKQLIDDNRWGTQFPNYSNGMNPPHLQDGYYPLVPALFEECYYTSRYPGTPLSSLWENIRLMSNTYLKALYLEKIEFPSGTVEFIKSPRRDAYGLKLDKIQVKNSDNVKIKAVEFNYDYFEGSSQGIGTEVMTAPARGTKINYPEDYLKKRLKLLSFSEKNNNESQSETYSFTYENTIFPYKTSFSQDFWGYYNGKSNNTLLPGYSKHSTSSNIPPAFGSGNFASHASADRNVYPYYTKAGVLTGITHPASGKTTFEYEPNECMSSSISGQRIETRRINAVDFNETGRGWGRVEFTLEKKTKVSIKAILGSLNVVSGMELGCYSGIPYASGMNDEEIKERFFYAAIEKYYEGTGFAVFDCNYVWEASKVLKNTNRYESGLNANQELGPGRYRLTACFPDSRGRWHEQNNPGGGFNGERFASLTVSYDELIPAGTSKSNDITGGLRIKKVTQTDPVGNTSIEKNYTYKNGILATRPAFIYRSAVPNPDFRNNDNVELFEKTSLYASPVYPYSFSANGSLVGYRNVTETYSAGETGRVEYTYKMDQDISGANMPVPPTPKLTNGFLMSKNSYDKDNNHIKKQAFTDVLLNTKVYWGFKVDPLITYPINFIIQESEFTSRMRVYFYPIIQGKVVNREEREGLGRDVANNPNAFWTSAGYKYNDYGQVIEKKTSAGTGSPITETYKYVLEKYNEGAGGGIYREMREKNILSPLIETQTSHNGAFTRQVTNYARPYANIFVPSTIQLGTGTASNPAVETRITFDNYDKLGNPNSITKDNAGSIIYLWSYKGMYPVAEIRNADYAAVNTALGTVGLGSVEALSENAAPDKAKLDNLRNAASLAKAHITTYKYAPLIGIVEATAPNGITTFYKYDSFNRLQMILDQEGNVVESYEYHFEN